MEREVENALILGIARSIANGELASDHAPYFAAVWSDGRIVMAAFSNIPEKMGLTQAAQNDAIALLAGDVVEACPHLQNIGGPEPTAGKFTDEFAVRTGRRRAQHMGTRIHQLDSVQLPTRFPSGRLRMAVEGDLPDLVPWIEDFHEATNDDGDATQVARERIESGRLFVWDDSGPVSMAGWSGKTPNGVRINLVFTPDEFRGRGYASATVAMLSQHLLDQGNQFCCLYTDVANPTSNAIYSRIGYRAVSEAGLYTVAIRPPGTSSA